MKIWTNTTTLAGYVGDLPMDAAAHDAEFAVVGGKALCLADFPKLIAIFKCGVGLDNLDLPALRERNIALHLPSERTMDVICDETASFACEAILAAVYRDRGEMASWRKPSRRSARDTRLLVIGHGRIGRRVAERMRHFMQVEVYDAQTHESDELIPALQRAHIVSLHVPLTPQTRALIGKREIEALQRDATLINTSRGGVVDESTLLAALQREHLYATLDVYEHEPYKGPLLACTNGRLRLTPHIASTCTAFLRGLAQDLRAALAVAQERSSADEPLAVRDGLHGARRA